MRINRFIFLMLSAIIVLQAHANELEDQVKSASGGQSASLPSNEELHFAKDYFRGSLAALKSSSNWSQLGMELVSTSAWILIKEKEAERRGRGLYALRAESETRPWLLQAPHADSDKYTGQIAARLFLEGPFKAAQWNTVKRSTPFKNWPQLKADMAHNDTSYWQAFTQAFVEQYSQGKIVQLHGFDGGKRKTGAAEQSGIIVSAGHTWPPAWMTELTQCLDRLISEPVKLYPKQVQELGGTQNAQSRLLRQLGYSGFIHLEMSLQVRKQLLHSSKLRAGLIDCIDQTEH